MGEIFKSFTPTLLQYGIKQQDIQELQKLLQRAYTGDTAALNELVIRKPEIAGALKNMQELQQWKEGWEKFNNILLPQQGYSQGMPEGSGLPSEPIGVTPTQTGITQAPIAQPTLADIRNAMLLLTGARGGNFSELSGLKYLSEAATEDEKRRQLQEDWEKRNKIIQQIQQGGGITPEQSLEYQSILNALGVNTGNLTGGQKDVADINLIKAKIDTELAEAQNKLKEGQRIDADTNRIRTDTERLAELTNNLRREGRIQEAEAIEKEVVGKYVVPLKELELKNKEADLANKRAKIGKTLVETKKIQTGTTSKPLTEQQIQSATDRILFGNKISIGGVTRNTGGLLPTDKMGNIRPAQEVINKYGVDKAKEVGDAWWKMYKEYPPEVIRRVNNILLRYGYFTPSQENDPLGIR